MVPRVSIITVNFNGTNDTLSCLESLKKCAYPNFEVWVVDNGSNPEQLNTLKQGLENIAEQKGEGRGQQSAHQGEDASANIFLKKESREQSEKPKDEEDAFPNDQLSIINYQSTFSLLPSPTNLGFGGGNNLAIKKIIEQGESKYIYLLNNDTEVDPDFLTHAVARAETLPRLQTIDYRLQTFPIGIVNSLCVQFDDRTKVENAGHELLDCGDSVYRGRGDPISKYAPLHQTYTIEGDRNDLRSYNGTPPAKAGDKSLSRTGSGRGRGDSSTDYQLQTTNPASELLGASGAAVLYRLDTLRACGLFDESFFLNYEDADLSLRCILYGWKAVLEPRSIVYHKVNASIKKVKGYDYFVRSQYNQFRSYVHNVPTLTLLLNLPFMIMHDLGVPLLNLICMRWTIVKVFVHARLRFFRNFRSIWKVRRENLKRQKISGWYFWKLQRNFIPTYIRYFREIIVERRRSVFETTTEKYP